MAEKENPIRVLGKELRPHALWALIERIIWPVVGSTVIAALAALWQKLRHVSPDWFFIGGLFLASFAALALLVYLRKKVSLTPQGLPEHRPRVLPVAYGEESGTWGLTVSNPGYDATDVQIQPVVIAWSGYTLIFGERVPLLTERDHHRFIAARLAHPPQPGLGGDQLVAVMESASIDTLPFTIWFKDSDSRQYKSNCESNCLACLAL